MGAGAEPTLTPAATPAVMDRAGAGSAPCWAALRADLEPAPATPAVGRPRLLPSGCRWAGVLGCLRRGASTQRAVGRLLTHTRL